MNKALQVWSPMFPELNHFHRDIDELLEITASYRNGVLELTAPKSESAPGRKIPTEAGAHTTAAQSA